MTAQAPPVEQPHARPVEEVVAQLEVDPEVGLTSEEAQARRERHGENRLREQQTTPWWELLWDQIAEAVIVLLLGAAVAGFVIGEVIEAVAILVVLVVNTIVDVERDDRRDEVDATVLVPGDIVIVEAGEKVPADIRVLEAEDTQVEESALTGESEPVTKSPEPVDEDSAIGDRSSMLFMGTTLADGRARGVVVATGSETEMGKVAELAESAEQTKAPLQEGLDQLSRRLAVGVIVGAAVLFGIGVLRGRELNEVVEISIALAIAVVPEGLPAVATLTLAVGMRRMARGNALVRRLPAVETLGSTTVVCSDKTGTLTRNEMEVVEVALADDAAEEDLWVSAVLCNDSDIDEDDDPVGDPTEVALLRGAAAHDLDWRQLRKDHDRAREVPFDSDTMRMATVNDGTVHVKGAPGVLLDEDEHAELLERAAEMADGALRTLAIARRPDPGDGAGDDELFEDLEILGVVGMEDPPRDTASEAIDLLHGAGIRTIMITGDRPDTAEAIATRMDLPQHEGVLEGSDIGGRDGADLEQRIGELEVFARVDPEHKLRIVEALQERGEIVAVTGDGVNDAPALSQADVGVAMGSGTDVAKDAADIVLLDDRFATIQTAVEEGRRIFANIRRFGQFLFSWHVAEVSVITASLVGGFTAPLSGLMILWNNLVIDVLPSFALALEPSRADVMRESPRDPDEPVINRPILRRIATQAALVAGVGLLAFFLGLNVYDLDTAGARTMTFLAMSAGQTLAVFNARSDTGSGFRGASGNPWLWGALGLTAVLETVALAIPPLREVLGLAGLPLQGWVVAGLLGLVPVAVTQGWRIARDRLGG